MFCISYLNLCLMLRIGSNVTALSANPDLDTRTAPDREPFLYFYFLSISQAPIAPGIDSAGISK